VAELQVSEDRFDELAHAMRMIPWEADPQSLRITFIGDLVEEVMGYPTVQWLTRNFWIDRLHEEDRKVALEQLRRNINRLQNFDHEFRMYDSDGQLHWLRNIVNVVRDEAGQPARIRGFIVDITEGKAL
jgi:PAS domain S-box-containing protein